MSVHVMSWVFKHSEEDVPGRRLVLLALADKADHDGTGAYPAIATLAMETRMSERGVRYALRALESTGRIKRLGLHSQYGTNEYVVCLGGQSVQGGNEQQEGGQSATKAEAQIAPEPSLTATTQRQPSSSARAHDAWPTELGSDSGTPDLVFAVIEGVAADHNSRVVTRKALGHVLLAFPDRAQLAEAHEMASWWADKPVKDAVTAYRNWLKKAGPATEGQPTGRIGLHSVKAPAQKLEAKSRAERQALQEWVAANVPDLPVSQALSAAQRIQYAGHELTADRVRHHLGVAS